MHFGWISDLFSFKDSHQDMRKVFNENEKIIRLHRARMNKLSQYERSKDSYEKDLFLLDAIYVFMGWSLEDDFYGIL